MNGIGTGWVFASRNVIQHKKGYKVTLADGSWFAPLDLKVAGFNNLKGPMMATHLRKGLEYARNNFNRWKSENSNIPVVVEMLEPEIPAKKGPVITYKKRKI